MNAFLLAGQSNMVLLHNLLEAELKAAYGSDTVVIKAGVGSSNIASWQPGQINYNNALAACQSAMSNGAVFRGIFLAQGEADTLSVTAPNTINWHQRCWSFLSIRTALGNPIMPAVHSVLGLRPDPAIAGARPGWDIIVQEQIRAQKLPNLALIYTADFERNASDGLHVVPADRPAYAQRFCDMMKRLSPP
jgi:carbohydrate esterase-like sialic acid-specific acetylesterase